MKKVTAYDGDVKQAISLSIMENDLPKDLTSATVAISMHEVGSNTEMWSHSATVTSATEGLASYTTVSGDLDEPGMYYTLALVVWTSGESKTYVGPAIEVLEKNENVVTVAEFLQFLDIPSENRKSDAVIKTYLEHAESLIDAEIPDLASTTDANLVKQKKSLTILKGAILYFMNLDENYIDPNKRLAKLEFWHKQYSLAADKINSVLSSDSEGSASVRRVKSSEYDDPNSPYYTG